MKIKHYNQLAIVPVLLSTSLPLLAGNIDSSTAPGSTSSYTMGDVCNRFDSGVAGTPSTFTESITAPSSTGCTVTEMMSKAPAADNTNGALVNEVMSGKTFWGLRTDGTWGLKTGTLTVVDTSTGDATAADIAAGKKVWVNGVEITGTAASSGCSVVLPETGQTTCYDASGATISCAGTGQDGDKLAGATLPSPRFTDNGDGTVNDNLTGLIWLKNANCFGAKNWTAALSDANNLSNGTCGLTDGSSAGDWRLPNRVELTSLVNSEYYNPALSNAA